MEVPFYGIPKMISGSLRTLLIGAGIAAAASGIFYFLWSRRRDPQTRKKTVDAEVQAAPTDPAERLLTEFRLVEPRVLCTVYDGYISNLNLAQTEEITEETERLSAGPQPCGPMIIYTCLRLFLVRLLLRLGDGELLSTFWTLRFSYKKWHSRGSLAIFVRRHYVQLTQGAVSQSWWILSNDFFIPSAKCPIWYAAAYRVTFTERVEGHLTRVNSYMFTEHLEETSGGVQELVCTYRALVIHHDEWTFSVRSASKVIRPHSESEADSAQPSPPCSPQPSPGPAGESAPERREVPALHACSEIMGISNFAFKLNALRQAFTIILSCTENCNHLSLAGKFILGELATLNGGNQTHFEEAYEWLLAVAQDPSSHEGIQEELAQIGILHFNFIDVVYEVAVLGVLAGATPQICLRPGGFLDHLMVVISSFTATSEQRMPRADEYLLILNKEMMLLLQDILTMEECVYADPGSLATAVWDFVCHHIEQLMDTLEAI